MWHPPTKTTKASRDALLSTARAAREERETARKQDAAARLLQRVLRSRLESWRLTRARAAVFDKQSTDILTLFSLQIPLPFVSFLPTVRLGISLVSKSLTVAPDFKPRVLATLSILTIYLDRACDGLHALCLHAPEFVHALDKLVVLVLHKLHVWHRRSPREWSDRAPLVTFLLRLAVVLEDSSECRAASACLYPSIRRALFGRIQASHLYAIAGEQIQAVVLASPADDSTSDDDMIIRPSMEAAYAAALLDLCMHKLVFKHSIEPEACYESYLALVRNILVRVPDMVTRLGAYVTPILQTTTAHHVAVNWKIVGSTLRELVCDATTHPTRYHLDMQAIHARASSTGFEAHVYEDLIERHSVQLTPREALVGAINCYSMAIQSEYIESVGKPMKYGTPGDVTRLVKSFFGRAWCYCEEGRFVLALEDIDRAILLLRRLDSMPPTAPPPPVASELKDMQRLRLDCYMIRARIAEELGLVQSAIDDYTLLLKIGSKLLGLSLWKQVKAKQTMLQEVWARHEAKTKARAAAPVADSATDKEDEDVLEKATTTTTAAADETKKMKKKKKKAGGAVARSTDATIEAVPMVAYVNNVTIKLAPFKTAEELKAEHNRITRDIFLKESIEIAARVKEIQAAHGDVEAEVPPMTPSVTTIKPPSAERKPPALANAPRPPNATAINVQPPLPRAPPSLPPTVPIFPPLPADKPASLPVTAPPLPRDAPAPLPPAPSSSSSATVQVFDRPHHEAHLERKLSNEVKKNQTLEFILDGANIGFFHGRNMGQHKQKKRHFSARGIDLALHYFNRPGGSAPRAVAFLPQRFVESRYQDNLADDIALLSRLMDDSLLFLTPAGVDDDLFMLKYAEKHNLSIVTNDNLADHIQDAKLKLAMTPLVFTRTVKYMFIEDEFLSLQ
ncbi:Aste57867_13492 [Aphanomyces stellatus]|uniref:Aste57867_13492 protein n=1 Tax=Aphanomyces stellatus TaxID=120398 RepID=A0A485KYA0_9STRA|nr:hypothetical protein As57867_013442 [Aphanomyces stellatus]VFT90330.1 Aste57867_13492 [Aphanomyces stellatus]